MNLQPKYYKKSVRHLFGQAADAFLVFRSFCGFDPLLQYDQSGDQQHRKEGTNHLDAEPLTAADTEIPLDINGGVDFSYRRRSVLVQYNGHVYAASIYSEPHGDQTITNNNFDGQFCLHFYGSKTHGSDRVDEDHKECESLALKYTW